MTLRIAQDSKYKGHDRWEWSVWIEGPREELAQVKSVTYYLHPTFPNPVQVVTDRRSKFRLRSAGWGTFTIKAEIERKDGKVVTRSHNLLLEYPEQTDEQAAVEAKQPVVFLASSVADRPLVSALRQALGKEGLTLFTDTDLEPGLPWEVSIERALRSSGAAIAVVSDFTSPSVESEIQMARAMNVPVLPVRVGTGRELPEALRDLQGLSLVDLGGVSNLADQVVSSLNAILEDKQA